LLTVRSVLNTVATTAGLLSSVVTIDVIASTYLSQDVSIIIAVLVGLLVAFVAMFVLRRLYNFIGAVRGSDEFALRQEDIHRELDNYFAQALTLGPNMAMALLNKIGQNVLSLAAHLKYDMDTEVFANLMVYDPNTKRLSILLTHGFYYSSSFHREFEVTGERTEGSCGKALRQDEIVFVDDAAKDERIYMTLENRYEHMGSIINIPLRGKGVLNIDAARANFFTPNRKFVKKAQTLRNLAAKYLDVYTVATDPKEKATA